MNYCFFNIFFSASLLRRAFCDALTYPHHSRAVVGLGALYCVRKKQVFRPAIPSLCLLYCEIILYLAVFALQKEGKTEVGIFEARAEARNEMKCSEHLTRVGDVMIKHDSLCSPFHFFSRPVSSQVEASILPEKRFLLIILIEPSGNPF